MGDSSTFGLRTQLENTIISQEDEKVFEAEQPLILNGLQSQVLQWSDINI